MPNFNRRDALKMSAGFAAAATGAFSCLELAKAGPIDVPVIDKFSVRVIVDSDLYFKPADVAGGEDRARPLGQFAAAAA
jgi:7,8-dihydropterin-6-yl-methyl-4-(beta-D-ribofuranosyl)aminobenzene 5'-phosphate synthase